MKKIFNKLLIDNAYAVVQLPNKKYAYEDLFGRISQDSYVEADEYHDGFALVKCDDLKYRYRDANGKLSEDSYQEAYKYKNGKALVRRYNSIYRYRNMNGEVFDDELAMEDDIENYDYLCPYTFEQLQELDNSKKYQPKEIIIKILKDDPSQFLNIPEFMFNDQALIEEYLEATKIGIGNIIDANYTKSADVNEFMCEMRELAELCTQYKNKKNNKIFLKKIEDNDHEQKKQILKDDILDILK